MTDNIKVNDTILDSNKLDKTHKKSKMVYTTNSNNNLERNPKSDTINLNNKNDNKKRNILLGVTGAAITTIGTIYGVKKIQIRNIKNLQKTFQEVFMRDDITPEMAKAMKARYREIKKIKDPKEYAKALFEEAKKNYGMADSDIKLVFEELEDVPDALGFCKPDNSAIAITQNGLQYRSHLMNTMHHEFRHAKQHKFTNMLKVSSESEKVALQSEISKISEEVIDLNPNLDENGYWLMTFEKFLEARNIPSKDRSFGAKCLAARMDYNGVSNGFKKYWTNFLEIDARQAGKKIDSFVNETVFHPMDTINEWYTRCAQSFKKKS